MFNIRSGKCSPSSEVYWKKPLFTLLENYFFPSLELTVRSTVGYNNEKLK